VARRYRAQGAEPVAIDLPALQKLGFALSWTTSSKNMESSATTPAASPGYSLKSSSTASAGSSAHVNRIRHSFVGSQQAALQTPSRHAHCSHSGLGFSSAEPSRKEILIQLRKGDTPIELWHSRKIRLTPAGQFPECAASDAGIEAFMQAWNKNPKPFIWSATVEDIIKKIDRAAPDGADQTRIHPAQGEKKPAVL